MTALSVGKSVLNGALGYAKSTIAEEVALQLGVQRDQVFIRDELEMMQSFLMATHEEKDEHMVITTWVKQVRDVAYDVEDCLQDFAVRLEKQSWWRIPRTLLDRHRVAKQMKDLRAKVEDVSQRNLRYGIIKSSKVKTAADKFSMAGTATMFGIEEARREQDKAKVDLVQLISRKNEDLRVIAVWGTIDVLRETSIVKRAFDDPKMCNKFQCRAWVKLMHPFDPIEFLQGIMRQFYINSLRGAGEIRVTMGAEVLQKMRKMKADDLAQEFKGHLNDKSYLIVLTDLSTIEEWNQIEACFPNNREGSRIIVCTEHVEVASLLCFGKEGGVPEHMQLSVDHSLYAFCEKVISSKSTCQLIQVTNVPFEQRKRELAVSDWNLASVHGSIIRCCGTGNGSLCGSLFRAYLLCFVGKHMPTLCGVLVSAICGICSCTLMIVRVLMSACVQSKYFLLIMRPLQ